MDKSKEFTRYEKNATARIRWIIDTYCGGNQQAFSEKVGIQKSSVSQYMSGRNTPSNFTSEKIGKTFGLNPAWVMGFDVPKWDTSQGSELADNEAFREFAFNEYGAIFDLSEKLSPEQRSQVESYMRFLLNQNQENDEK